MSELSLVAARQELQEVAQDVARLKADMAGAIYDLGLLLCEVRDRELWRMAGYATFSACLESALGLSRRTAFKAMEIAAHFGPEIARRFGSEKVLAMHRYMKATTTVESPGDLIAADIRVRGPGGRYRSVPMNQASVRQIVEAARDLEAKRATRSARAAAREVDRAERLARLSAALPGAHAVRVKAKPDGRVLYDFSGVDEDDMPGFIAALHAEFLARGDGSGGEDR